ncbi:hypothetical protein D3C84_1250900 [compost metagenome]
MVGARCDDVARLEWVDMAQPFNASGNAMGHVIGIETLAGQAIHVHCDVQILRVGNFVRRDDPRSHRGEGIA